MERKPTSLERRNVDNFKFEGVAHDESLAYGQPLSLGFQNTSYQGHPNNENIIEYLGSPRSKHTILSPHDRLPPELLQEIFLFLIPGRRIIQTAIPPILSSPPWVIGQVNSTWRRLSRSMTELWGTTTLHLTEKCISPDVVQRALITLPDVCKIDVHVVNALGIAKTALIPHLNRVDELHWELDDLQLVELWSMLPPNALSRIATLDLTCSFCSRRVVGNALMRGGTDQFYGGKAVRLRFLKLDMPKGALPIILSMNFPWKDLTSLCISCRLEKDVDTLAKILHDCISLNRLDLQFYVKSSSKDHDPLILHKIRSITLLGFIPSFLFLSHCVWNELIELYLEQISLPIAAFCCILSQCLNIKHLSCCVSSSDGSFASKRSITLPHLRTLSITLQQALAFSLLQTPALEKMVITALNHLELLPISSLITCSRCIVDSFTMFSTKSWQSHPSDMRELLFSLGRVTSFSMHGAIVCNDLLDDIASGILLPDVRNLLVSTPTFDGYMSMVERRLQWERGLGKVKIGVIEGSAPEGVDERAMCRLKEVGEKYGVCCQFCEDVEDGIETDEGL